MKDYCKYLDDSRMMRFHPVLANIYGLNEAIFIQQLHYWLNRKPHYVDERGWVYNSYDSWQEQLSFWSIKTIQRIVEKLVDKNVIEIGNFNKVGYDRTKWYTLNYELIDEQINAYEADYNSFGQNDQIDLDNLTSSELDNLTRPIPSIIPSIKKERKKPQKKITTNYDTIIDELINNKEVKEAIKGFIQMRTMKKKPLTDRALKTQINKLYRLAPNDIDLQIKIIDKSIVKNWDEFYPYREDNQKTPAENKPISMYGNALDNLPEEQIRMYEEYYKNNQ